MRMCRLFEIDLCIALFIALAQLQPNFAIGSLQGLESIPQVADSTQEQIAKLATEAVAAEQMPGCVICFGRHNTILFLEAYGDRQVAPIHEPMNVDTVFDLASLTKPVATATSIMKLVEQGRLTLNTRIAEIFPEFAQNGKDSITIKHLLTHQSGLIPDNALSDYTNGPEVAWKMICELSLVCEIGNTFKYSDVNFIVLAEVVKKISNQDVHQFSQEHIFVPLEMRETGFLPNESLRSRAAPTEKRNDTWIQGEVHDPRAFALNGIAGHAGLFSTARDLARYGQMMLGRGSRIQEQQTTTILSRRAVDIMTTAYPVSDGTRGLGWDKQTSYSSNRGDLLSESAFGHGGFTGTVLWIDPELDLFFIFLSNRVHPNGKGSVNRLAGKILNVVASSIAPPEPSADVKVLTGIDVLQRDNFRELANQRVGLITNQTGRSRDGRSTVELFVESPEVDLRLLFSPEHGFNGKLDTAKINHSVDEISGLNIISLYGETRRPTSAALESIDTIVFDIQDIGTRFYTYVSTMREAMEATAAAKKRFVVLDRPNPIDGVHISGPMLDSGSESFVGCHTIPVRHAMTSGEIAMMLNDELNLDLNLTIIACEGWNRDSYWEQTNLTWVNPSPNMRSLNEATLYPGIGLLETTNLSVGRGTDTPFELVGAPWINSTAIAAELSQKRIPGLAVVPIEFVPATSKYANEKCFGVNFDVIDRKIFEPIRLGIELACALKKLYPAQWETKDLNRLLCNKEIFEAIQTGQDADTVYLWVNNGIEEFKQRRSKYLLYR